VIVIGGTGSGKSSLIKHLGGKQVNSGDAPEVGHSGFSKTSYVDAYEIELKYHAAVEKFFSIKSPKIPKTKKIMLYDT
jgi:ABC-type lipoprotein export system ATPase subunit